MPKFEVTITERLQKAVRVEAGNERDAMDLVKNLWKNAQVVLTAEDFCGVCLSARQLARPGEPGGEEC